MGAPIVTTNVVRSAQSIRVKARLRTTASVSIVRHQTSAAHSARPPTTTRPSMLWAMLNPIICSPSCQVRRVISQTSRNVTGRQQRSSARPMYRVDFESGRAIERDCNLALGSEDKQGFGVRSYMVEELAT